MKYLIFDQEEFDTGSEQSLLIVSSHIKNFRTIDEFALQSERANCIVSMSPAKGNLTEENLSNIQHSAELIANMQLYCAVSFKANDTIFVIHDSWDIHDYVFQNEHTYYRYLWSTTA